MDGSWKHQRHHRKCVGALDFSSLLRASQRSSTLDAAIRASKHEISRRQIDGLERPKVTRRLSVL